MAKYTIIYAYDDGNIREPNSRETFEGTYAEMQGYIKWLRNDPYVSNIDVHEEPGANENEESMEVVEYHIACYERTLCVGCEPQHVNAVYKILDDAYNQWQDATPDVHDLCCEEYMLARVNEEGYRVVDCSNVEADMHDIETSNHQDRPHAAPPRDKRHEEPER